MTFKVLHYFAFNVIRAFRLFDCQDCFIVGFGVFEGVIKYKKNIQMPNLTSN